MAEGLHPTPSNISRVAEKFGADAASWAFSQQALKGEGGKKFAHAAQMIFEREALEQASHFDLAEYHASFFPYGEVVGDLCSGQGADLFAIAARGPAIGYEIDEE